MAATTKSRNARKKGTTRQSPRGGRARRQAVKPVELTPTAISRGIGMFLKECQTPVNGAVSLGRQGGMTKDPDVVQSRIDQLEAGFSAEPSPVKQLLVRQRIRDLKAAKERLRAQANGESYRAFFVQHGAAWATEHGIAYGTFRECAVPADVLKEAGISFRG